MDDRRARNHARDRRLVFDAIPSAASWEPGASTEDILKAVRLPRHRVLTLLHELHVAALAQEAGGLWRQGSRATSADVDSRTDDI